VAPRGRICAGTRVRTGSWPRTSDSLFASASRSWTRSGHAYGFLLVALEGGLGVQEYADLAGVTQAVMPRILLALGSRSRGRERGYGLVQQGIDTKDSRKHQTFLTAKGKALVREIGRLVHSDQQAAMKLRSRDLTLGPEQARDITRDHWLSAYVSGTQARQRRHQTCRAPCRGAYAPSPRSKLTGE
jgi:DNA-binding MarR family transcriptional regulator